MDMGLPLGSIVHLQNPANILPFWECQCLLQVSGAFLCSSCAFFRAASSWSRHPRVYNSTGWKLASPQIPAFDSFQELPIDLSQFTDVYSRGPEVWEHDAHDIPTPFCWCSMVQLCQDTPGLFTRQLCLSCFLLLFQQGLIFPRFAGNKWGPGNNAMHGSHVNQLESHSFSVIKIYENPHLSRGSSVNSNPWQDCWGANLLDESLVVLRRLAQHHLRYLRQCWHRREGSIHSLLPNQDLPTPKIKHPANICQIGIISTIEKIVRLILPKKSHCPLSLGFVSLSKPKHTPFLQKNIFNEWSTSGLWGTLFPTKTWISYQADSIPIVFSFFHTSIPMVYGQSLCFQVKSPFSLIYPLYFWAGARPFCSNGPGSVQECYCAPLPSSCLSPDSSVI